MKLDEMDMGFPKIGASYTEGKKPRIDYGANRGDFGS
jgi:hypothetical protein